MELNEIVYIRRMPNKRLPFDVYKDSLQSIGNFIDIETRESYRPLTLEEEALIMPRIVGLEANHPQFITACKNYYTDINIPVPPADNEKEQWSTGGLKLNIKKDANGQPYVPQDYILYKLALARPRIAKNLDEAKANPVGYDFFLIDLVKEQQQKAEELKHYNAAMQEYLKITTAAQVDFDFVNTLLQVLKAPANIEFKLGELSDIDKLSTLQKIIEKIPQKFYEAATNKNLSELALALKAIDNGIITKINGLHYYGEIGLGKDVLSVVDALCKPTMTGELLEIKAKIEALSDSY